MATTKIHGARFLLTLDQDRRIIQEGSILIEGQRIVQVGKTSALQRIPADRVIDASEMVVTPGFVNPHAHISYPHAARGVFPDTLGGGCMPDVFKLHWAMTEEEEYYTTLLALAELLKNGTTCVLHPGDTQYVDACVRAYEASGCRGVIGVNVTDQSGPYFPVHTTSEALAVMEKTIQDYNGRLDGRLRAWVMLYNAHDCSQELLIAGKRLADAYDTGLTFHQSSSAARVEPFVKAHGKRPLEYLDSIGVLGPNVLLAHVLAINEAEIETMARTHTKAVMIPITAARFAFGTTVQGRLPEMLERNVCVGIGTDSSDLGPIESLRSAFLMALLYKDARQDPTMIPAETALEMATIQGARTLGLDAEVGSIEVGKKADLVLFDTRRPEWRTLFNPVNNLVYNADGRSVHTVIVDGQVVVENHALTFLDEWALIQHVQTIGENLLLRTGMSVPSRWPMV